MPLVSFGSNSPVVHPSCFIAENATLIGNVTLGRNVSIWFGAVLRADIDRIEIGANSNIQDNSVIHIDRDLPTIIGEEVTVGHNAIIHAAKIAPRVLVGMGSVILDGAEIGEGCIIAAGSVVRPGSLIPPRSLIAGIPAQIKRAVTDEEFEKIKESAKLYVELAKRYRRSL